MSKSTSVLIPLLAAVIALAGSCSTTRVLEDGQYRLAKNTVVVEGTRELGPKDVDKYIRQKANSYILLGWNPFLNFYNLAGKDSTFMNNLIRKVGTAPVVYDASSVEASRTNMERHLEYLGWYNSEVESKVEVDGRKVNVTYTVHPGQRYKIGKITYSVPEGEFAEDFYADTLNLSVKSGDYLSESSLEGETERSAAWMRRRGWFGFTKNFYSFEADTLQKKDTADLLMTIREYTRNQSPEDARPFRKYTFGDVTMSWDKDLRVSRKVLRDLNTIVPGTLYDETKVSNTYSRLSSIKLFSGVNVAMNPRDSADIVDCDIVLTPSKVQGFKADLEGSSNTAGLIGISPQLSYFHKNIFHGGQWFNLGFMGNFQFLASDRSVRSNELGISASVSFPEFLGLPNTLFQGPNVPRTEIKAAYNYQDRPEYRRSMISGSYSYSGSLSRGRFRYQIFPVQANIAKLYDIDPDFIQKIATNAYIWNAYIDHFDVGSGATVYYTTCADINPKVSYRYVRFQADASGNVLSLLLLNKPKEFGTKQIWGIPYSQYVRGELTLGNTIVFGRSDNQALAFRLLGGYGYAYGNSQIMPYEKQFYSGGASSMRGWQARTLGPGSSKIEEYFKIPSQTGDIKLEANMEYRFPLFWKLNGALFTDVGNIWYSEEFIDAASKLTLKNLWTIAADWGAGLRVDLNFLVLRLDLGIKLYDPSRDDHRWLGPEDWRSKDAYALHFGVGYPF